MKKIFIILLFLSSTTFIMASEIKMMTENYPPYNMEFEGELQGVSIDIVEEMLKQMNSKKKKSDIELLAWSKGYDSVLKNKNHLLFATTRTKSRENLFKWVGPITKTSVGLTALKSKNITIKDTSELKNYRIGTVKSDIGETLLYENDIPKKNIYPIDGVNSLATSFYRLENEKIDMLSYETTVALYSADLNGYDTDDYEIVYTLQTGELYFAFNKLTSDEIINKWQEALDTIKKNGIYTNILNKYKIK